MRIRKRHKTIIMIDSQRIHSMQINSNLLNQKISNSLNDLLPSINNSCCCGYYFCYRSTSPPQETTSPPILPDMMHECQPKQRYQVVVCNKDLKQKAFCKKRKYYSNNNNNALSQCFSITITLLLLILTYLDQSNNKLANCQRFNPQQINVRFNPQTPVNNNNINYNNNNPPPFTSLIEKFSLPEVITQQGGIIRDKNVTLTKQYNPILITKDIIIKTNSKLTIESGTEISFAKNKGIIVHGTLEILGNNNDRVKLNLLKSSQSATVNFRSQNNNPIQQQQVRLVDGELPSEGRVQIKFNDKWHSLCTNSKNLTAADIKVICQQVGYQDGHWYKWFPKRNETLYRIMSKSFHCTGSETAITQCKRFSRVRAGGGICDPHSDLGVRCSKTLNFFNSSDVPIYNYWRGIEFVQSDTIQEYILGNQMMQKISKSTLQHLVISDAGVDDVGNARAAIRVYGQPPRMNYLDIRNSVYGIMIEDTHDAIKMSNIRLQNIMGNTLFVNTSWGKVSLDNMHVENNGGDGIRIVRHERVLVGDQLDFCRSVTHGPTETFPVVMSHEQPFFAKAGESQDACCQEFFSNNRLTVHFPVLRSTPNNLLPETDVNKRLSIPAGVNIGNDAHLVIHDDYQYPPFRLRITNGTRAQSIVSRSGMLKICYEPATYRTVLFTIQVVVDRDNAWSGIANDVEITNSYISGNQGRGIWVDNSRGGVYIANTTVLNHNYVSGIHIENGTGQVIIEGSKISNNIGHGIFIDMAGGYYHIDNSTITHNTQRGIWLEYDKRRELVPFNHTMHLGYSLVSGNGENGLFIGNVCRSDAFWNISMNSFINNGEDAIFFQSCLPSRESLLDFKNSTSRIFHINHYNSDFNSNQFNYQELFITHNVFVENFRRAIRVTPAFFVKSFIRHNLFREHPLAVIYINCNQHFPSMDSFNSTLAPTNIRISSNRFYANRGRYVTNIGLQEDNPKHSLVFTKNFIEGNEITEPYIELRPRSRVSAVIVVSSSNTKVIRNRFDNPGSEFDLGSHLDIHSKVINATANYWGRNLDATSVYRRIFDRKNRYNLAQVEFLQYLLSPEDLEYAADLSFDRERDKITTFKNGTKIGGEVRGYEDLSPDTYNVVDDIFVRPGGHLILRPGTVLKFSDGVGMMVQGRLDALGSSNSQIQLTSSITANRLLQRITQTSTTTPPPQPMANPWVSLQSESGIINDRDNTNDITNTSVASKSDSFKDYEFETARRKRQINSSNLSQNVRLSHTSMGRLEVQIDGIWGSVCNYNFDINDAAVACQQLGMIINKDDWLLEKFQYAANDQQQLSMMSTNALMTNLRCDSSIDTDITKCKAEVSSRGEFDGMCDSEVGIRCFPPSWSGVRLGMGAETSTLEHLTIQRAGMFDYATFTLKPALQIDFNRHWISSLVVRSNSDSGMGIMWNDVIGRHFRELSLVDCKFMNNERHGLELRTKGLTIDRCTMANNRQNGLDYNPSFSPTELNDMISWLYTPKNTERIIFITFPTNNKQFFVPSSEDIYKYFIVQKNPEPSDTLETFTISTNQDHMLSIDLLNPIHPDSTESLNISIGSNPRSPIWDLRTNMTSFPMIVPGYKFHFNYTAGQRPKGNIVLYIRSRYNGGDIRLLNKFIPNHLVKPTIDLTADNINSKLINTLVITNTNITKNGIGLKFRHPNYFYGQQGHYNIRYSNETTNITNNIFDGNHFSPIFVGADDYELFHSFENLNKSPVMNSLIPPSEIYYNIMSNKIRRNKDGIRQFSRDVRQSFNVFHWKIEESSFELNKAGGINIVLPYFWKYDANLSHTIELNNNSFSKNIQFELILDGHFAVFNLTKNIFKDNRCRNGLINVVGMEKRMLIRQNILEFNTCNRVMEFDIYSHADKLGSVPAYFEYNILRSNRRGNASHSQLLNTFRYPKLLPKLHPEASNFALSLQGIQSMNITRNLFVNPDLKFELVLGVMMDPNLDSVNAIENYWGSVINSDIADRIFDFDDWNNYALVRLSPFLSQESLSSAVMYWSETLRDYLPDLNHPLGGRLTRSLLLPYRKEPYIIESDLTIMPNAKLTLDKGVVLEFMPNVGILVLGDLIAAGSRDKPIHMRPAVSAGDIMPIYPYLFPAKVKPNMVQMNVNDQVAYDQNYIFKHLQMMYPMDLGSVRLCKNEICNDGNHIYDNNVEEPLLRQEVFKSSNNTWKIDGFLEIFNMTTLKWVPVCDPLFTEHTARVVCKQLGYSHLTLFKRGCRYTMQQEQISSISHWPESVQCEGNEANLGSCPLAPNGYTNQTAACHRESNQFIYVYCQDFPDTSPGVWNATSTPHPVVSNEHLHHWGGIRFACPNRMSASNLLEKRASYSLIDQPQATSGSRLQYVVIDKAGMSHGKKSAAVQVLQCNVQVEYTVITNSAHHGLEILTSHGNQNYHQLRLRNNLGIGINYLPFSGSSSGSKLTPYLPLKKLDISPDIFGLVDICSSNKEIQLDDRMFLFYRYSSKPVDCIKIISSKLHIKHVGIRMLQFDLFNSTSFSPRPDSLRIYDGHIFDRDSRLISELGVTDKHRIEKPELKFYETTDSTISVRLHASGSSQYHGFIAEVVTTPIPHNSQRDTYNNITFTELTNNKLGAISISSAGETSPNLIIRNCRIESNCLHLFGNFTSCMSPVYMELQNCPKLRVTHNLFKSNQGGIVLKSYSHSAMGAIEANIENNVFEGNLNTYTLALLGPKTDPYQSCKVSRNFFTRNQSPYLPNIVVSRVVANFSHNIVSSNLGKHQIEVIGFERLPISLQSFDHNWIYNNTATSVGDRSTICGNSAAHRYYMNYIVNPANFFELSTMNWSRYDVKQFAVPRDDEIIHLVSGDGSTKDLIRKNAESVPITILDTKKLDLYLASINAKYNWWGLNTTPAIRGRIRDQAQHSELIKVDFIPYLETNASVLNGVCAGGWQRVGNSCLVYIGSRMTYAEAKEFCDRERASFPVLNGNHYELTDFLKTQDKDFDSKIDRIWVRSFNSFLPRDTCPALNDYRTRSFDCGDKYSFICEKDPIVVVSLLSWHRETAGIFAFIFATIIAFTALCCSICWSYKSRERQKERIERKNSIYASMRSNRGPYSANNSLSDLFLHRQMYNPTDKSSITDLSVNSTHSSMQPSSNDNCKFVRMDPAYGSTRDNQRSRNSFGRNSTYFSPPKISPQPGVNRDYVSQSSQEFTQTIDNEELQREQLYREQQQILKQQMEQERKRQEEDERRKQEAEELIMRLQEQSRILEEQNRFNQQQQEKYMLQQRQYGSKPVTPAPSYRDLQTMSKPDHHSRTPSYSGSHLDEVMIESMPIVRPVYSQINHALNPTNNTFKPGLPPPPAPPSYIKENGLSTLQPIQQQIYVNSQLGHLEGSSSSAPTYYSNQIEGYQESSNQSLLDAISNVYYDGALQRPKNNDQVSFILTEKTSTTDEISRTIINDSRNDLISMNPMGSPVDEEEDAYENNNSSNQALSESGRPRRYVVETSLDNDSPLQAPLSPPAVQMIAAPRQTSVYGSSQRLSPVPSHFSHLEKQDSKHGSRVYLETSFE